MAKIISIITAVTLVSLGFWYSAEPWVNSSTKFADPGIWIAPAIMLIVLSALLALAYVLLPQKRLKLLTAFLVGGTYLVIFGINYLDLIVFFLIPIFHLFAIRLIQLETQERLKIHPGQIITRGITFLMIPLYLALSFAYFSSPSIQVRARDPVLSPTFKQIVSQVMDKFLQQEKSIPDDQKQAAKTYALERAYDAITKVSDPYRQYFPPALAFGLFLILWGLGFILHQLAVWLGMLLFIVLKKTHFIFIEERQVNAETISMQNVNIKNQNG